MQRRGVGPHAVAAAVERYLVEEAQLERVDATAIDTGAVARLLTGAALHEAFLATYAAETLEHPRETAQRLVDSVNLRDTI